MSQAEEGFVPLATKGFQVTKYGHEDFIWQIEDVKLSECWAGHCIDSFAYRGY
jgi:hypothetical protein